MIRVGAGRRTRIGEYGDGVGIDELEPQTGIDEQTPQGLRCRNRPFERRAAQFGHQVRGEQDLQPRLLREFIERIGKRLGGDG